MSGIVFEVQKRARGNVTSPMLLWAILMAVVLFLMVARIGSVHDEQWTGIIATALFGIVLGWRRRTAAVFIAPAISWLFAWFPIWIAAMIHDGFFSGLFRGLFLITIGWIVIGGLELLWLGVVAFFVRLLRGSGGRNEPRVVVFGPDER